MDLVFGTSVSEGGAVKVFGMSLSDSPVDKEGRPGDEIIKIDRNGKTAVAQSLLDMAEAIDKAKKEAEAVIQNIKDEIEKAKEGAAEIAALKEKLTKAETNYNNTAAQATEAVEAANKSVVSKDEADKAAMEAAMAGADSGGPGSNSAVDALNDAAAAAAGAFNDAKGAVDDALGAINDALGALQMITDALSSIADIANQIADGVEGALNSLGSRPDDFVKANIKNIYIDKDAILNSASYIYREDKKKYKIITSYKFSQTAAIKFNVPEIVEVRKEGEDEPYLPFGDKPFASMLIKGGDTIYLKVIGANEDTKFEVAGKRVNARRDSPFSQGIFQNFIIKIPDMSAFSIFGTADCISITATNSNQSRMKLGRQMGNDLAINLEKSWDGRMFGGGRNKQGPSGDLAKHLEDLAFLKFTFVKLGKVAGGMKESLQSFCDFSFHLTAELSLQLRNLRVLMVPIKVIFCIIDVICALLNPWRLAFAIIRLFLCLYDLILLLPPIAVPAMYLALLIHLLDLLLCVILKVLSTINAINEVVTALARAIEQKNYPAIVALEEALNEHIFSLETDLSVLEPIITILALFLELLQLAFAFPCRVGADDDDEACIDPSQLAGLILGKVAPRGPISPDVLLPLAQAYTRLPAEGTASKGNSPPDGRDSAGNMSGRGPAWNKIRETNPFDVVVRPQDEDGAIVVRAGTPGLPIPTLINNSTGENVEIEEGGYFRGDEDGDGRLDNVNYPGLKTRYIEQDKPEFITDTGEYIGAHNGFFDATFGLSFTKSTKEFSIFTGPDPRIVKYRFNSGGVTSDIAWWTKWLVFPIFFNKKTVSEIQTIDSKPMFLGKDGSGQLIVDSSSRNFVSPIDGFDDFLRPVGGALHPKPLTVTFELNEPGVNPDTFDAEFTPVTVTKTFGNIPMIAIVDDEFNVYFVEKNGSAGGIVMDGGSISSINLKMINYPSAPKKKTGREKQQVFNQFGKYKSPLGYETGQKARDNVDRFGAEIDPEDSTAVSAAEYYGVTSATNGEAIIQATANATYFQSKIEADGKWFDDTRTTDGVPVGASGPGGFEYVLSDKQKKRAGNALLLDWEDETVRGGTITFQKPEFDDEEDPDEETGRYTVAVQILDAADFESFVPESKTEAAIQWSEDLDAQIPYPKLGRAYDFGGGSTREQRDIGNSIDAVRVFDFPRFYIVDMRQLADDIAAACGASGPAELLMDMPGFDDPIDDDVQDMMDCMQAFMKHFNSESLDDEGIPEGLIPKLRYALENGTLPKQIPVKDTIDKYEILRQCVEDQIEKACRYVVNPLNTGFKLLGDEDETPLSGYIDPEQAEPGALGSIIDELEFDEELEGFPSITGAMEYASGIGDSIVAEVGTKAVVEFLPRDSDDAPMHAALDMTEKIRVEIVEDETGGAQVVPPNDSSRSLVERDEDKYFMAVETDSPGKVVIKGSVCGVTIQAVSDRGIVRGSDSIDLEENTESAQSLEGCVDDASASDGGSGLSDGQGSFAPGQLMKVDRTLTILFVPAGADGLSGSSVDAGPGGLYGDGDRDASARSAKPVPQKTGTKLEN